MNEQLLYSSAFSDPVIMSVKSSTSYAQEDLDLINSEILNLEHSASPLLSEARTPKSDSCGEMCYSRPESSADSLNLPDSSEVTDNEYKAIIPKEESKISMKDKSTENSDNKVTTVAMQLGIVEPETAMKSNAKDLMVKEELKLPGKEFDKSEELKPKVLNRGGMKFFPGAKLEAKDFNEKWQVLSSTISIEKYIRGGHEKLLCNTKTINAYNVNKM